MLFLLFLIIPLLIAIIVGFAASRRGYSGLVWFVAYIFGGWFTLGPMSSLPDRKLEARRVRELADLQAELAKVRQTPAADRAISDGTLGDQKTIVG